MTRKVYDGNSTKQEELDALTRLSKVFGNGSYLYDFFTPALMNWLTEQIRNDFVPDLMGYVKSAEQEAHKWHGEFTKSEQRHAEEINTLELEQKTLNAEYTKQAETISALQRSQEYWADEARERGIELTNARGEIADLNAEIIRLKAKLYDLTENCGAA